MAKPNKNASVARNNAEVEDIVEEAEKEIDAELDESVRSNSLSWTRRPDWSLSFQGNNLAIINGVSDEDVEMLQSEKHTAFAKEVHAWVQSNAGKKKISKYRIAGREWNLGTRGPGAESPEKNPFKLRPAKQRNSTGEKGVKVVQQELTSQQVIAFILAGKLDMVALKEGLDGIRQQRLKEIHRLQQELASFDTFEKLAASGRSIGGE
jgi:hypothetical protein